MWKIWGIYYNVEWFYSYNLAVIFLVVSLNYPDNDDDGKRGRNILVINKEGIFES